MTASERPLAGIAEIDISPPLDTQFAGDIGREWANRIRDGAAERFGFDRPAVMVHSTQRRSALSLGNHRHARPLWP